jgi:tRNA (cytidine/uridine-2'-O-)-methyltransferase
MLHIVLFQPEIPPNTGNIMRLCANTGMQLHLIKPLGFELDDKRLRRAGLDYREWAEVRQHEDFAAFVHDISPTRIFACSTKGRHRHTEPHYQIGDALLFGPETRGLPADILSSLPANQVLRLPMVADSRSLNLSNAVSIFTYEAWRQLDFRGSEIK